MELKDSTYVLELTEEDQKWIRLIEEWRNSGKTIVEWVGEKDEVTYRKFAEARKRLYPEETSKGEFLEQETTWSALSIDLPLSTIDVHVNGCKIVVGNGFDQELLRELVEVLKYAN